MDFSAPTWSRYSFACFTKSDPNKYGATSVNCDSSCIRGVKLSLIADISFSLRRSVNLALALPISIEAVINASLMSCTAISLAPSRMAVRGARASKMNVWSLASSLSALCADCEVTFFNTASNFGDLVTSTLGNLKRLLVRFLVSLDTPRVHESVRRR